MKYNQIDYKRVPIEKYKNKEIMLHKFIKNIILLGNQKILLSYNLQRVMELLYCHYTFLYIINMLII